MRIVIDLQGAQTESRFRGIGRYSLSLAQAMARNRGEHEIFIALNGLFPDTIEPIRAKFDGLISQENIRVWYTPAPVHESVPSNTQRRKAAELIREAFLNSLKPDIVHVMSMCEGFVDDAVTSIGTLNEATLTSVSFYDLIPLLNQENYFRKNSTYQQFYLQKIAHLCRSQLLLSISESSRKEALENLSHSASSIVNISTAADECFRPLTLNQTQVKIIQNKFGLTRSTILYTGGDDKRKNLPRLIRSYAQLSDELRKNHHLVLAGKMHKDNIRLFRQEATSVGLRQDELIFTGYITNNDLVALYNLCKLYVFPSWHEGFGLPALEAMSCGKAVIASNTSSLPEVIENTEALFDPFSVKSISEKLTQALENGTFRLKLEQCGYKQAKKFSWDKCGKRAISALETLHTKQQSLHTESASVHRQKLAYISPLPPEQSGISYYSIDLLRELSIHYDIDVIVAQKTVDNAWVNDNCQIRNIDWFRSNASSYERVLYHFGNSRFHQHMFNLLDEIPGIVVLHDFFLSSIVCEMEGNSNHPNYLARMLYLAHGYYAFQQRFHITDLTKIIYKYPCNFNVLRRSLGIISHSKNSQHLVKDWYSSFETDHWNVIPLLRSPALKQDRAKVRKALNLNPEDFVVCSFGMLDPTKLNHKLLDAWLASSLVKDNKCILIFVGKNHGGNYGEELLTTIQHSGLSNRIHITGWVDTETYKQYLTAADVGVQLRALSRGETSAAALDCMNFGLATIVNNNGSMADLPENTTWKLPNDFSNNHLMEALETLWHDKSQRLKLGSQASDYVANNHAPRKCAELYKQVIEKNYEQDQNNKRALIQSIAALDNYQPNKQELVTLAHSIAQNSPELQPACQLLLDISATSRNNLKTGIERVACALILELIKRTPQGYRIEPVYLTETGGRWHYRYARKFTASLLNCPANVITDEPIDTQAGDIIIGLDLFGQSLINAQSYLDQLYSYGIKIHFLVFDLLPIQLPNNFPAGADTVHTNWLRTISRYDGAVCISKSVANELSLWVKQQKSNIPRPFKISWFHLGADIKSCNLTQGLPNDTQATLKSLQNKISFLMVGTIEPRKGYAESIAAFEQLWDNGVEVNLVIVGNEGWKGLPDKTRRIISQIVNALRNHPKRHKNIFWLENVSDEYLERIYASCTCLIAASEGEGFGLPLIEAAQHSLPIIARDIPVFREVAGNHAFYFDGNEHSSLATAIQNWLSLYEKNQHPDSTTLPWITWKQSTAQLLNALKINTL